MNRRLLIHRFDLFAATVSQDSAGSTELSYPTTATVRNVACHVQPATSKVIEDYARREERVSGSIFLADSATYERVNVNDRIRANGFNYLVRGKYDMESPLTRIRVFRIDVDEEAE